MGGGLHLCLSVPCFPAFFDLLISLGQTSANKRTQGNKGQKGKSLGGALITRGFNKTFGSEGRGLSQRGQMELSQYAGDPS